MLTVEARDAKDGEDLKGARSVVLPCNHGGQQRQSGVAELRQHEDDLGLGGGGAEGFVSRLHAELAHQPQHHLVDRPLGVEGQPAEGGLGGEISVQARCVLHFRLPKVQGLPQRVGHERGRHVLEAERRAGLERGQPPTEGGGWVGGLPLGGVHQPRRQHVDPHRDNFLLVVEHQRVPPQNHRSVQRTHREREIHL